MLIIITIKSDKHIMKSQIRIMLSVAACLGILPIISMMKVYAESPPAPPASGSNYDQRLVQRKLERNLKLDDKTQKRISSQCVNAQGVIRKLQQDTKPLIMRSDAYNRVDSKLWIVIGKLKLASKDTVKLEGQRLKMAEKATAFQATSNYYKQALDDAVVINCQADPVGFKSLVDTARAYQSQLLAQAQDIRKYVANEVKLTLSNHANDLQPKSNTGGR